MINIEDIKNGYIVKIVKRYAGGRIDDNELRVLNETNNNYFELNNEELIHISNCDNNNFGTLKLKYYDIESVPLSELALHKIKNSKGETPWYYDNQDKIIASNISVKCSDSNLVVPSSNIIQGHIAPYSLDKHYDFTYNLTDKDIEKGKIKIDPYFVSKQWEINNGNLFHVLKTVARFGRKNPIERETKAILATLFRYAELENIDLTKLCEEYIERNK